MEAISQEAMEYLVNTGAALKQAETERKTAMIVREYNERPYYKGDFRPLLEPEADTLHVGTLTGIKDYLTDNPDGLDLTKIMVHVINATRVAVRSVPTGPHKQRPVFMEARAVVPDHLFDRYIAPDEFVPYLQSCFAPGGDIEAVIKVCGNVTASAEINQKDDGVTQTVTAKTGVVRVENVEVPSPAILYPFSSFVEINQPARKFVLRFKGTDSGSACKLIDADNGAWQIAAIESLSTWLREALPEGVRVIA